MGRIGPSKAQPWRNVTKVTRCQLGLGQKRWTGSAWFSTLECGHVIRTTGFRPTVKRRICKICEEHSADPATRGGPRMTEHD
jgi:hypothetical protein